MTADLAAWLDAWFVSMRPVLSDGGLVLEMSRSGVGAKTAVSLDLVSEHRLGRLTVWSSGEAVLERASIVSGELRTEQLGVVGERGLADATDRQVRWVRDGESVGPMPRSR